MATPMTTNYYVESSAIMKLFEPEPESEALRAWLIAQGSEMSLVTSELTKLEVLGNLSKARLVQARDFFDGLALIQLKRSILDDAVFSMQVGLKTLDAIHHATIRRIMPDLEGVISYDKRLNQAITQLGARVFSPAG